MRLKSETLTEQSFQFQKYIGQLINELVDTTASFACWRMPKSTQIHFCASSTCLKVENDLENIGSGFAVAPFMAMNNNQTWFIPLEVYGNSHQGMLKESPIEHVALQKRSIDETSYSTDYPKVVEEAINTLDEENFMKVVLARKRSVQLNGNFDPFEAFLAATKALPNHFVSLHYTQTFGLWLGASPETLISINGDIFHTVALAGSQAYVEGTLTSNATWTQKEIEEQALVSRYIIDCLKKIRLREYQDIGPKTVIAGNLMHLKTEFWVNMKETNFPQLGTVMLRLLHPTSAVCGSPKEKALEFINTHEGFDRKLFSGYIGPVNIEGKTDIFVNLRCAEILGQEAILYAGAGITTGSNPEKEFLETEMKMQSIGRFLQ